MAIVTSIGRAQSLPHQLAFIHCQPVQYSYMYLSLGVPSSYHSITHIIPKVYRLPEDLSHSTTFRRQQYNRGLEPHQKPPFSCVRYFAIIAYYWLVPGPDSSVSSQSN